MFPALVPTTRSSFPSPFTSTSVGAARLSSINPIKRIRRPRRLRRPRIAPAVHPHLDVPIVIPHNEIDVPIPIHIYQRRRRTSSNTNPIKRIRRPRRLRRPRIAPAVQIHLDVPIVISFPTTRSSFPSPFTSTRVGAAKFPTSIPSNEFAASVASVGHVLLPLFKYTLMFPSLFPTTRSSFPSPFTSTSVGAAELPTSIPSNGFATPVASVGHVLLPLLNTT